MCPIHPTMASATPRLARYWPQWLQMFCLGARLCEGEERVPALANVVVATQPTSFWHFLLPRLVIDSGSPRSHTTNSHAGHRGISWGMVHLVYQWGSLIREVGLGGDRVEVLQRSVWVLGARIKLLVEPGPHAARAWVRARRVPDVVGPGHVNIRAVPDLAV